MVGSSVFHIFLIDVNNIDLKRDQSNWEPRAELELDNYSRFFLYYKVWIAFLFIACIYRYFRVDIGANLSQGP